MAPDPFRIRDHVSDFDDIVADIARRSAVTRATIPSLPNIAYGQAPSETVDLFFPRENKPNLPVHMFIHGGYWRMFSKRDYSCIAETVTRAGGIAVIVDHALMPAVRLGTIVGQVRRAKQWVVANIAGYGGNPTRLTVSGHSAGAHLATFLFDETNTPSQIAAALLLGGIYDLKPLQSSFLRSEIGLTDEEVASYTPMTHGHDPQTRAEILVGEKETAPFHAQADAFAAQLRDEGLSVSRVTLTGRHHMDSVRDLALADSQTGIRLMRLIAG